MSFTLQTTFVSVGECCECGMPFAVPSEFYEKRREDHKTFYCPKGHPQSYDIQSDKERLKDQLAEQTRRSERAEQRERNQAIRRREAERRLSATRGVVTRIKNRIGKGVCPCCNRAFKQLGRHMKTQHPEYAGD